MEQTPEPNDRYVYRHVTFYVTTLKHFRRAVAFTEDLLKASVGDIQNDPDLGCLFDERDERDLPVFVVLRELEWAREWLGMRLEKLSQKEERFGDTEVDIDHMSVRVIKSAAMLYIRHLKVRRNEISAQPNLPKHVLQSLDRKITEREESFQKGVFQNASTIPFLVDELLLPSERQNDSESPVEPANLANAQRPRPVVLDSIEIIDEELRHRCLDLLAQFRQDGDESRLDTVVSEATRILEHRLRQQSHAGPTCIGVNLAAFAFGANGRLKLSDVPQEQEGAHQLFRGVFAFIRNHVGHHLVDNLSPQRALQIVGMVDYLLYLIDDAKDVATAEPSSP